VTRGRPLRRRRAARYTPAVRVAAVQFKPTKATAPTIKSENLRRLVELARGAKGAELVVLPEMAATGYVFSGPEAVRPLAEVAAEGETRAALSPLARELGAWVVAGLPEVAGGRLFNSALVLDPSGGLAFVYRKTLLYEADLTWATPGDSGYRTFEAASGDFGVGICMDLNDDAFTGWLARRAPRAVAFPTNWVSPAEPRPHDPWPYWAWRLERARVALVAANTWGRDEGVLFTGVSAVLDRVDGRAVILAAAGATGDGLISCVLPPRPGV
jgi:N-carbamoylputrescine amidase